MWLKGLYVACVMVCTRVSMFGVAIRGKCDVETRVVSCRVFKKFSYGHLCMSNSEQIYQEMDGNMIYNPDPAQLFHDGMKNRTNFDLIRKGMQYVKENHTYINRATSLLKVFEEVS